MSSEIDKKEYNNEVTLTMNENTYKKMRRMYILALYLVISFIIFIIAIILTVIIKHTCLNTVIQKIKKDFESQSDKKKVLKESRPRPMKISDNPSKQHLGYYF